ncbi:hypothetical protein Mal4_50870 [Maioricimonas rarisocia]|uniref:3-keto-alpha-glucoside-1,2-lyase/3-keto-2-hydroxy-glucal hydratase domain-containing protein n=1 Tax=Maioricimonas rarisocia TaxID=2528026 RepID=A0A517ZE25_9PLAN|nr:DUF1080 domain-containing protein [Maioricimonas rarisocia]QDU40727.1 hypothetical protein Mal4_50870 [Maioricimonas rarisocia]
MSFLRRCVCLASLLLIMPLASGASAQVELEDGFTSLFNGTDLTGWTVPEGDNGHWKVLDGVIDYDAASEATGDRNLWTEKEYGDFILKLDWRIKETSGTYDVPIVLSDGSYLKDATGTPITIKRLNADSGVYLRGTGRAQMNIWCWPVGSGEVYGYRNNKQMPTDVRAGVTPRINADNPVGEWNTFEIIMVGDRLTVLLNDHLIIENARLPDVPERGRIALQHHGGRNADGTYKPASSLVQFRNIWIKELPTASEDQAAAE